MRELTYIARRTVEWREALDPKIQSGLAAIVAPVAATSCDVDSSILAGHGFIDPPFARGHERGATSPTSTTRSPPWPRRPGPSTAASASPAAVGSPPGDSRRGVLLGRLGLAQPRQLLQGCGPVGHPGREPRSRTSAGSPPTYRSTPPSSPPGDSGGCTPVQRGQAAVTAVATSGASTAAYSRARI